MLRCNTLIINNAQQIESGNIPVNLGEKDDIKIENGELKIKDELGNWNTITNTNSDVKVENDVLKIKKTDGNWVDFTVDSDVKVENGDVVVRDDNGVWTKIKNKYSKIKISNYWQTVGYSWNQEYEISFNHEKPSDSIINYDDTINSLKFIEDGIYVIHYNVSIENLSNKTNNRVESYIKYNNNIIEQELDDSFAYGWIYKKNSGVLTLASSCVVAASINDTIKIVLKKTQGNGYFKTLQKGVSLIVIKIN